MALERSLRVGLIVLLLNVFAGSEFAIAAHRHIPPFNRSIFPSDFMFGFGSAAYQFEGAAFEDGKGPSVWDKFTHLIPSRIANGSNGDVATDFYHRYKDDVKLMKFIGIDAFRFSISWARILPHGKLSGGVNRKGIDFYNNLINELLSHGIQPFVTIFHFDSPQALEDEYNGFLSHRIVDDFRDFAEVCFKAFGDRVKYWTTINEPQTFSYYAYDLGAFAPGRCSAFRNKGCFAGNSATEPYIVGHNLLLSHAAAARLYKEKYQASQKGKISITLSTYWFVPYSTAGPNIDAAKRALDFNLGWYLRPIIYGDYPESMRKIVGNRLPKFTPKQAMMLKESIDFVGLNYYTGLYTSATLYQNSINSSYSTDMQADFTSERNGIPIGKPTGVSTFYIFAQGFYELLIHTKEQYNNPIIYITETGLGDANNVTAKDGVKDYERIEYFQLHFLALRRAMKEGVRVKGLLAWAFLDNMEWASGYTVRFGSVFVDFNHGLKRYLKQSAYWFKKLLLK